MKRTMLILALALGSCEQRPSTSDQLADMNAQDALDKINALSARVDDLEMDLANVNDEQALLAANLDSQMQVVRADHAADVSDLENAIEDIRR